MMKSKHHIHRWILLAMVLCLVIIFTGHVRANATYSDVPADAAWQDSLNKMTLLEIVSGTPSGQFLPNAYVTREQFTKMAVSVANLATEANIRPNATTYPDVPSSRWSSGYIRTATHNGLLAGFPDGLFHPEQTVTWVQALSISLRILGHEDADRLGNWTENVLKLATAVRLTDDFSVQAHDPLTRKDCVILMERLLDTEVKQQTNGATEATPSTLATSNGLYQELVILSDASTDSTLSAGEVRTISGILKNASETSLVAGHSYLLQTDGRQVTKVYRDHHTYLTFQVSSIENGVLHLRSGSSTSPLAFPSDISFYDSIGPLTYTQVLTDIRAGERVTLAYPPSGKEPAYLFFSTPFKDANGSYEKLMILDTSATNKALKENEILTDQGQFTIQDGLTVPLAGTCVGALIQGNQVMALTSQVIPTESATVLQAAGTQVIQIRNGTKETISLPLTATWYHKGAMVPSTSIAPLLARNTSIVYGLDPDGGYAYAILFDPLYSTPQVANSQEVYSMMFGDISLENVTLSREGRFIGLSGIKYQDIAYEVTDIWGGNRYLEIYGTSVSGTIEAYAPNRFSPSSVRISVYQNETRRFEIKTYSFSPEFDITDLSGTVFMVDDHVRLLLGRDGNIVRMVR